MVLFGRSRLAQDALEFANANLKSAGRNTQDRKQALKYCRDAKKELGKIKISASLAYLDLIIEAYCEHGRVLEKLGLSDEAIISYKTADKLKQKNLDAQILAKAPVIAQPSPLSLTKDTSIRSSTLFPPVAPIVEQLPSNVQSADARGRSGSPVPPEIPSTSQLVPTSPASTTTPAHNLELVPASIFAKDFHPQPYKGTLPNPDDDMVDTHQLAFCLALLQASPSPDDFLDEPTRTWLHNTRSNEDEQERLKTMATDLLLEFMRDTLKDEKTIAEIACIAPVLEDNNFRSLIGTLVAIIRDSPLLPVYALEGLDRVIKCATPGNIDPDDLIKILDYVKVCLQGTYTQSSDHIYRLTRTVSHILDAMVDGDIKGVDRVKLHTPLWLYMEELKRTSDSYMVFQAAYAFQALLRVPDEEQHWQTFLRHTGAVVKGGARLFTAVKGFDVAEFIDTVQVGLEAAGPPLKRVGDAYRDMSALKKSGQGFLEALKNSFTTKRDWYLMLRGIDALLQNGELNKFKSMVCNAPCRRELAFQWGVCQRLGNLAADPIWDADSQEDAVAFLGEIYRNDTDWGQEVKVKQYILDTLMHLSSASGCAKSAADLLLQEFAIDDNVRKRALYDACRKEGPSLKPWKATLPLLFPSLLLASVQKTPAVEADLRKFGRVRLQELGDTIYIAPEAKAHRQAADDDLFDLTTKAREFLGSNRKVLLIWGNSGAGKSTFNKELEKDLWNDYRSCKDRILKKEKKIPIFVTLPAINKSEPDIIGTRLREACFSEAQIQELKAKRKFVLICDGYDEYQQRRNLYDINHLNRSGQWSGQLVITCRSEYLGHDYRYFFQPEDRDGQMGEALLQEAVIAPFSKERIQSYIEKYVAMEAPQWDVNNYLQVFDQVPSLQELVTNPFLLSLSLRVLPNMADLGSSSKVTRVMLYDRFVEQWVEQGKKRLIKRELVGDDKKAFDVLSDNNFSQNAILFVKKLAVAIFENQNGSPVVKYPSDREEDAWKVEFFGQDNGKQLLREACPLDRNGNKYQFYHKSLLEYCVARAVFEPLDKESVADSASIQVAQRRGSIHSILSFESLVAVEEPVKPIEQVVLESPLARKNYVGQPSVLQFLAERVQQELVFKQQLLAVIELSKIDKEARTRKAAANAITILVKAGVRFNGEDLKGIQVPGADLSGGLFDSTQLQGADLRNVNLRNVWLRQADLTNARMSGVQFGEWPYLKEEREVLSCSYSPDGRTCAVSLDNGTINVYDTTTWIKIHTLHKQTESVRAMAYSSSSHQIALASWVEGVWLWDAQAGVPGPILSGHTDCISSVTYSPSGNQIASGSDDKTVRLWDAQTGTPGPILSGHTDQISSVIYSPSGHQIASGSHDSTVRLWDAQTGTPGLTLSGHTDRITSVTYSPSGHHIASGSKDKTVRLWDAQTGAPGLVLSGHTAMVSSVTYSPSGHQIASGSFDHTVRLWDAQTGAPGPILIGHERKISSVTYSPSGHQIASGSDDKTVRLWDAQTRTPGSTLNGHTDWITSVVFSPSGHQIASGSWDRTVRLWDAQTGAVGPILGGHTNPIKGVVYSPSGHQIASLGGYNTVQLWDPETGVPGPILSGHTAAICIVTYAPNGRQIASGSDDRTVRLWDTETGALSSILSGHDGRIFSVAYSPSGCQIASGSQDKTVSLWDAQTGAPGPILNGHTDWISSVTYSPSGHQIASGSDDNTVRLWDSQTGVPGPILRGHADRISSVKYSSSGCQIASGSYDKTVRLWDTQTGAPGPILSGHTTWIKSVTYSPNGRQIVSGSDDKTVRLWDVDSGQCLFFVEDGPISGVAWNVAPDGIYFAIGYSTFVRMWMAIQDDGHFRVRLDWSSGHDGLSLLKTSIQNVKGMSKINTQLSKQRGAVGEPTQLSDSH